MILWALSALAAPLTLDGALGEALQSNLEIASSRRDNTVARRQLISSSATFDPVITASGRVGGSQTPTNNAFDGSGVVNSSRQSVSLGVAQQLPTGGSLSASYGEFRSTSDSANAASNQFVSTGVDVSLSQPLLRGAGFRAGLAQLTDARLALRARELTWRQDLEQLVIDVADAYWGLVAARQSAELAARSLKLAEDQLAETVERKDAGFAGSGDVLQVQVSVGQARRQQVDATAALESAAARLARRIGRPVTSGASLEPTDLPSVATAVPDRETWLASAMDNNVTLLQAELTHERAMRDARLARNNALPSVNLDGSVGIAAGAEAARTARESLTTNPAPSWGFGVSTQLPLVLRSTRAQYGVAQLRTEQAALTLEAARQDVELAVDEALRAVIRDRAGLDVANQTLEHARKSLAAQQELLGEGRGSTRDVVDALESLRSAEASKLSAEIACELSLLRARRVAGTLLDDVPGYAP